MAVADKKCIQYVLGGLLKHPQYLSEVDKYTLTISDFPSKFEKYIFNAIQGLYYNGAEKISPADVENYLSTNTSAEEIFKKENGLNYLYDIESYVPVENFPYYYTRLKKFNLLDDLRKSGFDISEFYIEDITDVRSLEVNSKFEELSLQDICAQVKKKLLKLEKDYSATEEVQSWCAADEIDELVEGFGAVDGIGIPIQGRIYTQVINGAERGALTIRSGSSGLGKTRQAVGDACALAYPIRFNSTTGLWESYGSCEKILFVITEQRKEQVLKMILAYLSDVNESKFKFGNFTNEEKARIEEAKKVMKAFRDNFIIIRMANPTIELTKVIIREACITHDISCVFYDYIFIGPALLNEFRGFNIRNDEALLMFATALKDLAIELNVAVFTSTQVNAKADDNKEIRNEASLAGGRSTINKADNGAIMSRPTKDELALVEKLSTREPNLVTDIFKVRSGQWTQVRIWSYVDLGTMRKEDLFITDSRLEPIDNFFDEPYAEVVNWEDEQVQQIKELIKQLNEDLKEYDNA